MKARSNKPLLQCALVAALTVTFCTVNTGHAADTLPLAISASVSASADPNVGVAQRLREELRAVMTSLIEGGAFGNQPPQQITLDVESPPQRVSNLGALIDSAQSHDDGVHVLAITPGSAAEHMGLRAGDVLVRINGSTLSGPDATPQLRQAIDALGDNNTLTLDVRREGATQTVSGRLAGVYLPAMHLSVGSGVALASAASAGGYSEPSAEQGCGRISDFDVAPRQQQLHGAKIISIDGVTPGPTGARAYRVSAGAHTVKVAEQIESRYLSFNDRQRNAGSDTRYKTLHIDVAPDTTTLVAARLNEDQRNDPHNGAYWDPVAWKQTAESCR